MSILSGFKKFKDYIKTDSGYQLMSRWTKSDAVIMGNGTDDTNTLEKNCGAIKGITSSLTSTSGNIAASASAVKTVNDSLGGLTFAQDEEGNWGYIPSGADSVVPFKSSIEPLDLIGSSQYSFYVDRNNDAGITHTTTTTVTVADDSIALQVSMGYYAKNGMRSEGYFFTDDYFDLDNRNFLLMQGSLTFSASYNNYVILYLKDESGQEIHVDSDIIYMSSHYFWDLSQYSGKYKLGFYIYTYPYTTGLDKHYAKITANKLTLI